MINVADYKEVRYTYFRYQGGTSFRVYPLHKLNYKNLQGKFVVTDYNVDRSELYSTLLGTCGKHGITDTSANLLGKTIYISKKSKVSRDVLRHTYKIVLDPDRADFVVFPKLKNISTFGCTMFGIKNNILYLCFLENIIDYSSNVDYIFQVAVNMFCRMAGLDESEVQHRPDYQYVDLKFINDVPEYREILQNQYPNRSYIQDTSLPFTPLNKISPETLKIWSQVNDTNLLEKLLVGSDWQKYPFTLWCFLHAEHDDFASECGNQGKVILEAIQYWMNYLPEYEMHKLVEPDDWNMLQEWIMYQLGVSGPSYIPTERVTRLSGYYSKFLKYSFAVMPTNISVATDLPTINNLVGNRR